MGRAQILPKLSANTLLAALWFNSLWGTCKPECHWEKPQSYKPHCPTVSKHQPHVPVGTVLPALLLHSLPVGSLISLLQNGCDIKTLKACSKSKASSKAWMKIVASRRSMSSTFCWKSKASCSKSCRKAEQQAMKWLWNNTMKVPRDAV